MPSHTQQNPLRTIPQALRNWQLSQRNNAYPSTQQETDNPLSQDIIQADFQDALNSFTEVTAMHAGTPGLTEMQINNLTQIRDAIREIENSKWCC